MDKNFFTIADYYSRVTVVLYPLRNILAGTFIQQIKVVFFHHGIPDKLVSDNAPSILAMSLLSSVNSTDLFTRRRV